MRDPRPAQLRIDRPGLSCLQDLGRDQGSRIGQMTGGALDQYSAAMANTLVASPPEAPLIELVAHDFAATPDTELLIAVTIDGHPQPQWEPIPWPAGSQLSITRIRAGLRVYLAVHGSVRAPRLLGSCAPDTVLGFGTVFAQGDVCQIDVDCPAISQPWFGIPFFRLGARPHRFAGHWDIPLTDGPDITEFGGTVDRLYRHDYIVGASSNHIGLRLGRADHGPIPHRQARTEVLSRGVPIGAVEVPAGNEILVLHRGRGVTAGYPVLAVVTTVGLSRLGQARPGDTIRFRPVSTATAIADLRRQQAHLHEVSTRVRTAFCSLGIPVQSPISLSPYRQESA
jgi:5-oxoprolinase (ATP-hydrolysing) subunit C